MKYRYSKIIFLLVAFLAVSRAQASAVVVGYMTDGSWSTYNTDLNAATWGDLSQINYCFATVSGTSATLNNSTNAANMISAAHAAGVRCYLAVGGAGDTWPTATGSLSTLASSIAALMTDGAQKFDGVDIDWELIGGGNQTAVTTLVYDLHTDLQSHSPGLAAKHGESPMGLTLYISSATDICSYNFNAMNQYIDWYEVPGYDMESGADPFQAGLYETTSTNTITNSCNPEMQTLNCISAVDYYLHTISNTTNTGGPIGSIPYNKMVQSMPFYAHQGTTATTAVDTALFTGTAGAFDATRHECTYTYSTKTYEVDTAQSFCDKMNWAFGKGMQGISVWELGGGLPASSSSMMTSIWGEMGMAVSGTTNACLTTISCGTGCTPTPVANFPPCGVLVQDFEVGTAYNYFGYPDTLSVNGSCGGQSMAANYLSPGLNSSSFAVSLSGAQNSTCVWGPDFLSSFVSSSAGSGVDESSTNAVSFTMDVTTGNTSGPSTIIFGMEGFPASTTLYSTNLVVPAASVGQTLSYTFYYSQLLNGGTSGLNSASLYQMLMEPRWTGNYGIVLDNVWLICAPTPTPTPTNTNSPTNTFTLTLTKTNTPVPPTNTFTNTPMPPTNTFTLTPTFTNTPIPPTNTFTNTPVPPTSTFTNTNTKTNTPVPPTNTFTNTPANTNTFTFTPVFTNTKTNTPVPPTNTFTNTPANTNTFTNTPTITNTNTPVPPTNTFTFTNTKTNTPVPPTNTFTNTPANTNTFTLTPTFTNTKTNTPVPPTNTFTNTPTITNTPTNTGTPTNTYTGTIPPTNTPTNSLSPTNSFTNTWTNTSTNTPVPPTNTFTNTFTFTSTNTPANTNTPTNSFTPTFTSTDTFTFTNTDTPTNTDSPTSTGTPTNSFTGTVPPSDTPTNTPTNTWTGTPTNSFTSTNTSAFTDTPTPTNSFTSSFTPTATFTATQPVVQLGNGPNSPSNTTVPAGSSNQVVLQVSVDNTSGESLQLSDLDLTFTGTGNAASGIVSVTLWKNPSGDGSTSDSTVLATVNSPFASGNNALVAFNDTVGAGATQDYLITYNFASGASAGTYSVSLANSSALSGQGTVSLQSLHVQGAPVNGALLTVTALTATPSFTATVTSSFTPVPPTATSTETPIVRVTIGNPYPNPINGTGDLSINVTAPGASSLDFAVFTTSFRKIWDDSIPVPQGASVIHWNLRDREGIPVSDGLYYIRLQVIGLHTTTKIFKVLVLQ